MIITNKHGLPESVINALSRNYPPIKHRMSVTDLVNAPLIRQLKSKHWEELEEDASDRLWMLLGTSLHYILEQHSPDDAFEEEKLTATYGKYTIVGKSDLYHNGVVTDWKTTSVYSFLLGDKPEWIAQLNVYAYLWRYNGFPVTKLQVNAILRDWSKGKTFKNDNYPKIPFMQIDIPLWDIKVIEDYIAERIALHEQIPAPECTPEERWERPTTYAVMKEGRKSAIRVFDTELEAELELSCQEEKSKKNDKFSIEVRKGENVRCENYCMVNKFCPYYQNYLKEIGGKDNE